tara:strand:- start:69 stop:239 length:171 start_codon:yes stop_codon:yes gene_type:complete
MPQPGLPLSHKAEHIFDEINLSEKLEYYEIMIILIGIGQCLFPFTKIGSLNEELKK